MQSFVASFLRNKLAPSIATTSAMNDGRIGEPLCFQHFLREYSMIGLTVGLCTHAECPIFGASLDGIVTADFKKFSALEAKCVSTVLDPVTRLPITKPILDPYDSRGKRMRHPARRLSIEKPLEKHVLQVNWQLFVSELPDGYLSNFDPSGFQRPKIVLLERSAEWEAKVIPFMYHVAHLLLDWHELQLPDAPMTRSDGHTAASLRKPLNAFGKRHGLSRTYALKAVYWGDSKQVREPVVMMLRGG
jgi:hypothetical protein